METTIQKKLLKLKKENKLPEKEYKKLYPSGSLTPIAYPLIKAHKPNKNYPARNIISHRGSPQELFASFLIPLIMPTIQDSTNICRNYTEFVESLKDISIKEDEYLVSFVAEALFPSIPLQKFVEIITKKLKRDMGLKKRKKLTPNDIKDLINLCISFLDFLYDNKHYITHGSGPIGLSLMVTIAQVWMDYTINEAIKI